MIKGRIKTVATVAAIGVALVLATQFRGHVRCYLLYPECSPLIPVPKEKPWVIPTGPVERAAYDYSHALQLPPGMPKTVPFDFKAARLAEGYGGKSVGQQYFEHLCKTEDVEVIHKVAKDVDGFQALRPRPWMEVSPLNTDRYGAEEPTGYGWLSDDDQLDMGTSGGFDAYVQPLSGNYLFVEYQQPENAGKVNVYNDVSMSVVPGNYYRIERSITGLAEGTVSAGWRPSNATAIRVPYLKQSRVISSPTASYVYTWRGLRRARGREFGIGGGEYLIADKKTGEVMGVKRTFNSTYVPGKSAFTNWFAARECGGLDKSTPIPYFVRRVLNPRLDVNDAFVPPRYLNEYRQSLQQEMESRHGQ